MHYDKAFKEEAVCLSNEIGIKESFRTARYIIQYPCRMARSKARYGENAYVGSGNRHKPTNAKDQRILNLEKENRELKRANDILKDALGFFAESRKK